MLDEFWRELNEVHGDGPPQAPAGVPPGDASGAAAAEESWRDEFDTSNATAQERLAWRNCCAWKKKGARLVDPPALKSGQIVREDTPYYIAAAFPKIFQTGAGDYWAFRKERQKRKMDASLWEWVQHCLLYTSPSPRDS